MTIVKTWLDDKLHNIDVSCTEAINEQQCAMHSRLGPQIVLFDLDYSSTVRISNDRLSVRSQGSFNTVRANTCVFGGRWMYEVIWSL